MKAKNILLLSTMALATLTGCTDKTGSSSNEPTPDSESKSESLAGTTLTLYSSTSEANLKIMIPKFEADTGIKIEYVYGSTGDIVKRVSSEKNSPQADVVWLPTQYVEDNADCYISYKAKNDASKPTEFQSSTGFCSITNFAIPVLIYNTSLVSKIEGYADLLSASLKGKIAFGDAAKSSSAYNHLENMLLAMGTGSTVKEKMESTAAWDYVDKFYANLDKKIVSSSGTTLTGVVSGEYAVGMSWDTKGYEALQGKIANPEGDYKNVDVCYMKEGVVPKTSGIGIIKGTKKEAASKAFVDWMSSKAGQTVLGKDIAGTNPVLAEAEVAAFKKNVSELKTLSITSKESTDNKAAALAKYTEIVQKYTA